MKFKKIVPIILASLALSAALIGCSGGDTSTGSQTTDSSVTVSYTHLDVYKRQHQISNSHILKVGCCIRNIG